MIAPTIAENLAVVRRQIEAACELSGRDPATVELLAVSKTRSAQEVRSALAAGQLQFGENRVQELLPKARELGDTAVRWHMIGSLQTNKVRDLLDVPGLVLVHSVDRQKLVDHLAAGLAGREHPLEVLLQINATGEAQKHGVDPAAALELAARVGSSSALRLLGLMAMGPLVGDPAPVFAAVARLCEALRDRLGLPLPVLSLGMTDDLREAVAAGSTLVRVGTGVFGPRSSPADRET